MTTTVTLETHAWPVDVETVDCTERSYHSSTETVPPHTKRQFYVHSSRNLRFTELPLISEVPDERLTSSASPSDAATAN